MALIFMHTVGSGWLVEQIELTGNDTALITAYQAKNWDLSFYNITNGWLLDSVLQEIDPETGMFQWRSRALCYHLIQVTRQSAFYMDSKWLG